MTLAQLAVLAGLAFLLAELVRGKRSAAMLFATLAFVFILLDLVPLDQGIAQLTNQGLLTVVVLLLLSIVLDKSRLLEELADRLVRGRYRVALARLFTGTALYSAFLNNTAVVASLIGPLKRSRHHPASRLLLPMCYAASLGGVLTLVGSSTNLLVNSLMIGQGLPALHIFDLFPVGICIVLASALMMIATYPRLLPMQPPVDEPLSDYFIEAKVRADSRMVGRTVEENGLRQLSHLFLAEMVRDGRVIAPVEPDRMIRPDDILVFTGDVTRLDLLARFDGLITHGEHYDLPVDNLVEVVVAANSVLARRTIKQAEFRAQFDAAVVAVRRGSERLRGPLADVQLEVGDTLVLAVGADFDKRNNLNRNFVIVSRKQLQKFSDPRKSAVAITGFLAAIVLSALGVVELLKALLALLALFLALGYVRTADLRRNMPYAIIVIIAAALVIAQAVVATGAAGLLASALLHGAGDFGPHGALALVLGLTWLLTELMTNNAAAALAFPVAFGVAQQLGVDPMPFLMAVIYGASCSFLTPYGYQTNLMVMSPGRYQFSDYLRAGAPIALVFLLVAFVAIPVVFPF